MTPEGFMTFRDFTGAASAVQSLNYHTMEIALYGYDPRKTEVFKNVDHLEVLNDEGVRAHRPLSAALASTADQRLKKGWVELDRSMAKWRGGHYRFARTYLPSDTPASGGTDGAAYVKRFVKKDACVVAPTPSADCRSSPASSTDEGSGHSSRPPPASASRAVAGPPERASRRRRRGQR